MRDFELAKDKVMMGAERRSMIISEEEKRNHRFSRSRARFGGKLLPVLIRFTKSRLSRAAWLGSDPATAEDEKHTYPKEICSKLGHFVRRSRC